MKSLVQKSYLTTNNFAANDESFEAENFHFFADFQETTKVFPSY